MEKRDKIRKELERFRKGFRELLKEVSLLFKTNFRAVSLYIVICSVSLLILSAFNKELLVRMILEANHVSYIGQNNLKELLAAPATVLLLLVFFVIETVLSLFEIAGLLHAYSMAQIGRKTNLLSMFVAGVRTIGKTMKPKNWLIIPFIFVLLPLTRVLTLSASTFKLAIPGFVQQKIDYTQSLSVVNAVVYLLVLVMVVLYVFAINYFILQEGDFMKSCRNSRLLGKGHYLEIFASLALLTLCLNFTINSISSVVIINLQELVSFFQKNVGILSKSAQIGVYAYVLRQILKGFIGPAINNAAITVLFYRYIDEKELLGSISPKTFRFRESTKKKTLALLAVIVLFISGNLAYMSVKYSFLAEPVERPLVCAHRGDNVHAPENTMPAFELAAKENLEWIELDVHQTSDGVILCCHDGDISRVTGRDLTIHDHTYEELTSYKVGDWMPGDYEDIVLPTLKEALLLAGEHGMKVQVELKGHKDDVGFEENVLKTIDECGMHDDVMIISLDAARVMRVKELDPGMTCAFCMVVAMGHVEDMAFSDNVSVEEKNVTPELVHDLHESGKKVFCWTIDEEDTLQYLVSCGVDVIGTDNPLMVSSALDKVDYAGGLARVFHILMNAIADMDR